MKKLLFVFILLFVFFNSAFGQVENIAKDILKAYKDRNPELLKKYASGILINAISESYFKDKEIQDILAIVDGWDGKIKEIRYNTLKIMGKTINSADVYFADNPKDKTEIYVVSLSSMTDSNWVMFGRGIISEELSEFKEGKLTLAGKTTEAKGRAEFKKEFSIEMANGDTFDNVSDNILEEQINNLNDDNFFIILKKGEDFLQAAFSDNGFTVEYKENGKQFETKKSCSKEMTLKLFKDYLNGKDNWKESVEWESM